MCISWGAYNNREEWADRREVDTITSSNEFSKLSSHLLGRRNSGMLKYQLIAAPIFLNKNLNATVTLIHFHTIHYKSHQVARSASRRDFAQWTLC